MGLFSYNYDKPGKGIDKDAPEKKGIFSFFDLYWRKLGNLVILNFIYDLAIIPTFIFIFWISGFFSAYIMQFGGMEAAALDAQKAQAVVILEFCLRLDITILFTVFLGMGPVTAGFTYILRNYSRSEHVWIWSDFWERTKMNFKQSAMVWIIDVLLFVCFGFAYAFYSKMGGVFAALKYFVIVFAIIYLMMHLYIYPMIVSVELSLKKIYKNALLFALGNLPVNALIVVLLLILNGGIAFWGVMYGKTILLPIFMILEFILLFSTSGFIANFGIYSFIKKYLKLEETSEEIEKSEEN